MSVAQEWLVEDLKPLKLSISSGMRLATKKDLASASASTRRDPAEKCQAQAFVYRRDVVLKITGRAAGPGSSDAVRGAIRGFTHQSRRRLTHLTRNTADLWTGFLTLTYPAEFPADGREVKRHLNLFTNWLRKNHVAYIWILEFQDRGAPHFHFLISGWLNKTEVAERWTAIVNPLFPSEREKMLSASTRIEAVKNPDQVGAYISAYMSKLEQKIVPKEFKNVGRFWGASRTIYRLVLEPGTRKKQWKGEPLNPKRLYRMKGLYSEASRALRICRRWYARRCKNGDRGIAFRWKWRGQGFILADGVPLFNSLLRQSVMIDAGRDVWKDWDGMKDKRAPFLTPNDRLNMRGQMLIEVGLDGSFTPTGFAPEFPRYNE